MSQDKTPKTESSYLDPLGDKPKKKSFVRILPSRKKQAEAALRAQGKAPAEVEVITSSSAEASKKRGMSASSAQKPSAPRKKAQVVGDEREVEVLDAEVVDDGSGSADEFREADWSQEEGLLPNGAIEVESGGWGDEPGLAHTSPLQRYLSELRRYPLMTIEEERATALKAYEHNDPLAKQRLITANLRLVVKIAMEYRRAYSQMLDLIQEGNAGLAQAVQKFNPYMNVKLSTYSAWWIRAYILKFLMDNKSLVRMGTTDAQRKLFFRLRSEMERMYALTQKFDVPLLAERIGVKEQDVIEMHQRLTKNDLSLDAPIGPDGDTRHIDMLSGREEDPDARIDTSDLIEKMREQVEIVEKDLNERDLFIFRKRILSEDPITLQEVGDTFGITRERARQLESRILKKMKERLERAGIVPDRSDD